MRVFPSGGAGGGGAGTPHDLLDGLIDQDTVASAVTAGDLIFGNSTPLWDDLAIGSTGQALVVVAGFPAWGVVAINGGGLGRSLGVGVSIGSILYADASTTFAALAAGSVGQYLRISAGAIPEWHTLAFSDISGVVGVAQGGTNISSYTAGDTLYASGATTLSKLAIGTAGLAYRVNAGATAPEWAVLGVAGGGTGIASYAIGDILYAAATTTVNKLAIGTAGQVLRVNGAATAPEWGSAASAVNTGFVFNFLPAQNEPPAADAATFVTVAAATGLRPYLEFDGTTDETAIATGVLRPYNGGGFTVTIRGTMDGNNAATKVVKLSIAFEKVQSGDVLGAGGNDFAAAQSAEIVVDNTSGTEFEGVVTFSNSQIDGLVTGNFLRMKITRNNSGLSGTNATGRFRLLVATVNET